MLTDTWRDLLVAIGLGAARTLPISWLLPALGGPRMAASFRVGLGLLLAVLCLPLVLPMVGPSWRATVSPVGWIILLVREVLVGATVGFCAGAAFQAAEAAGGLVDEFRGASGPPAGSLATASSTTPTANLYALLAVLLFLEMDGLGFFMRALASGYEAIPVAAGAPSPAPFLFNPAAKLVVLVAARLIETAVQLAAPVLVASWAADILLGLAGRAFPQLPMPVTGAPTKALLGLGVVLIGLGAMEAAWTAGFPGWATLMERGFSVWRSP